jgi:NarL family two-component system response regulator LiaR
MWLFNMKFEFKIDRGQKGEKQKKQALAELSVAEMNVFKELAAGKTNQEIADELFISVNTVKKHITNIYKKLSISSRKQAREYSDFID